MIMRSIKELLVAIAMLGGVSVAGVLVARDLGQAVQVIRTCEGRGQDAHCR
jgi:hypothetical protein